MNQILFTQDKRNSNSQDTKKIVLFFAVTLIVFGLILFGQGVYGVYKGAGDPEGINTQYDSTNIQLLQNDSGEVVISVNSQIGISELIYNWNSEASQTISGNGEMQLQETVSMPAGENTLTVKTIDINGKQTTESQTFKLDVEKPEISLSVLGNNIKIVVNSNVDLSYVTYKWNSDPEEKMDMLTYEDKTKFEKEIEIPKGQNTLVITAVDIYENKSEKSQEIKGVAKPVFDKPKIDNNKITFTVTADEDIKEILILFNNKNYKISEEIIKNSQNPKKVSYTFEMIEGVNFLKVKAITQNNATEEKAWKYEYIKR